MAFSLRTKNNGPNKILHLLEVNGVASVERKCADFVGNSWESVGCTTIGGQENVEQCVCSEELCNRYSIRNTFTTTQRGSPFN